MDSVPGVIGFAVVDVKVNLPFESLPVDHVLRFASSIWTSACEIGWPVAMSLTTPLTWLTEVGAFADGDAATALIVNVSEVSESWPSPTVMVILPEMGFVPALVAVTVTVNVPDSLVLSVQDDPPQAAPACLSVT